MLLPLSGLTGLTALRILSPLCSDTDSLNNEREDALEPAGPEDKAGEGVYQSDGEEQMMDEDEEGEAMDMEDCSPQVPQREPELHLHFIPMLQNLKVLVLTCITSSGLCFRHISGLPHLQVRGLSR